MWKRTHSKHYENVRQEDIWWMWTDINNWPAWNNDLEYCRMEGAFAVGNHFMLKPYSMKKPVKIMLTEIQEGSSFTDCTTFFGAKMWDTHEVEATPNGVLLTNRMIVNGPLTWLWVKLVAQYVADTIEDETDALVELARKIHG